MINIIDIKENFIISNEEFCVELISYDTLEEYINILRSDFYNEFLDFKFNSSISREKLLNLLNTKVEQYIKNDLNTREFRFIVLNSKRQIIAGFTLYINDKDIAETQIRTGDLEIAYFVMPEYQRKGIASNIIYRLIAKLKYLGYGSNIILAHVQYRNNKSLNMLKKLQFKRFNKYRGKFGVNLELRRYIDNNRRLK